MKIKHSFKSQSTNTGRVTAQSGDVVVILKKDGKPLTAGDLKPGQFVNFDRTTGEIKNIRMKKVLKTLAYWAIAAFAFGLVTGCAEYNKNAPWKDKNTCMIWAGTFAVPMPCGDKKPESNQTEGNE